MLFWQNQEFKKNVERENSHHKKEYFYENIQLLLNEIFRIIIHPVSLLQIEK